MYVSGFSSWFHRKKIHAEIRHSGRPVQTHRVVNPYHAVRIEHGPSCCIQVRAFEGQRILAAAAPRIPLPDCDAPKCRCRYVHLADRRSEEDRRERAHNPREGATRERRQGYGRRVTD